MKADLAEGSDAPISDAVAQSTLDDLLADTRFRVTERGKSIIKYIASHYFSGSLDGIKGYNIAIDVLGRPASFDPSNDPIVRIELSRLRTALFQYYEAYGHELHMAVDIPRGKYTITFTNREKHLERTGINSDAEVQGLPTHSVQTEHYRLKFNSNLILSLAAVLALVLVVINLRSTPLGTTKPLININMHANDQNLRDEANQIRDALITALTQYNTLTIQSSNFENDNTRALNYEIEMKYYQDDGKKSVWWAVRDVDLSEILQSGIDSVPEQSQSASSIREAIVPVLAAHFATSRSAINLSELKKSDPHDVGNACLLRAEQIPRTIIPSSMRDVLNCLERTLQSNPDDSDANAALAQALLFSADGKIDTVAMERSRELARRAVRISPQSDRALTAMMLSQFYSGKVDAAIDIGRKALSNNPNNPTTLGLFAWILFTTGNWEKAIELTKSAERVTSVTPPSVQLVLAFDAYRQGDWSRVASLAQQTNGEEKLITALHIAALGQLGSPDALIQLNDVQSDNPDFISQINMLLAYERMVVPLRQQLLQGLNKASADGSRIVVSGAI
ncbi:tetratricopeptide repeat protein [Brucella thiophenivorans]|uniref:Tetratricopeptide repeat family protein n=1 Tax=Brucella thiophenivorans TaxID=571255 RepID=A0A256FIX9_9HYPH|nr:tetratricopeptide repeat protein [Brucella thiophenivorans]OYR14822.1 tetratricopeptide repeat family protein [Brucella thiophenivorans]